MWLSAAEPPAVQQEELQVAVDTLRQQNEALQRELREREKLVQSLTESLAIARTETDLFQQRWADMQLRLQTLGVSPAGDATTQWQRQLMETIRSLYLAEAEKERVLAHLKELVSVVSTNGDVAGVVKRAEGVIAASEQPRQEASKKAEGVPTLAVAKVLDVNAGLRVLVLNVGEQHGARVGMPFVVLRGDRVVAELRVVEVRRSICGALIEKVEHDVKLIPGDQARITKS